MPSMNEQWHVYLLTCADNTLYCGITTNVERRLAQHNGITAGGAKYTRARRPVQLCCAVCCRSRGEAQRLEAHIKAQARNDKVAALKAAQRLISGEEKA